VLDGLYQDAGTDAVPASPPNYHSSGHSDTTGGQSFHTQTTNDTTYDGQEYRSLQGENHARYLRAEIGLRKERLAAYRLIKMNSATNVDYAKAMTTADVRKIQLSYIDTFLVAPFDGVITAVFRNVGDFVTAGQPVLRLENDQTVYLVGQIKCRGLIRLGDPAHISTTLFGIPGEAEAEIDGTVCAIRGHEPIDEQWNVVIRCNNETPDGRALPLNYNFDFDNTQISLGV
jgi:biotin carboxyl carrier protein